MPGWRRLHAPTRSSALLWTIPTRRRSCGRRSRGYVHHVSTRVPDAEAYTIVVCSCSMQRMPRRGRRSCAADGTCCWQRPSASHDRADDGRSTCVEGTLYHSSCMNNNKGPSSFGTRAYNYTWLPTKRCAQTGDAARTPNARQSNQEAGERRSYSPYCPRAVPPGSRRCPACAGGPSSQSV